jgi:hypothetical protein
MFGDGPHTPAFLRKSVEGIEWKGVVKHSWCQEREERGKERKGTGSKTGKEGDTERKGKIWREWGVKSTPYYSTVIVNVK